ncbi:MAG: AMP-binding protein [Peptostreptococcaceae bacterium]|nr:AMP-binding protein [Peptostreptococcaceae bacterium]
MSEKKLLKTVYDYFFENREIIFLENFKEDKLDKYDLLEYTSRAYHILKNLDKKEEKFIIQINNNKTFMATVLALFKLEIVPMIVPICKNEAEFNRLVEISSKENSKIISDNEGFEYIDFFNKENINLSIFNIDDDKYFNPNFDIKDYIDNLKPLKKLTDDFVVLYSSGSTSMPKGIRISEYNILCLIEDLGDKFNIDENDVFLNWMPLEHAVGLNLFTLLPIGRKSKIIHFKSEEFVQDPSIWFEYMNLYKVSISCGPNFSYKMVISLDTKKNWDLSNLKLILNCGEPISKELVDKFEDFIKKFNVSKKITVPAYGLSETTGVIVLNDRIENLNFDKSKLKSLIDLKVEDLLLTIDDIVCQGQILKNHDMRIVDEHENEVDESTIGYVQLSGRCICNGYTNKDNKAFFGKWLETGDIGFIVDKNLYIVGRQKDMVFRAGKNIYLRDIEKYIEKKFNLKSAACGINISNKNELIICVFISQEEIDNLQIDIDKEDIIFEIRKSLGILINDLILMDKLLFTKSGKVSKGKLMKYYLKLKEIDYELQ